MLKKKIRRNIRSNLLRIGPLNPPEMPQTDCYKSQRSTDSRAKITLIDILFTFPFLKRNAFSIYILTFRIGWKTGLWSAECEKYGVWNMRSVENALTLTDLLISKHFNAFIQHKKCLEMFYS